MIDIENSIDQLINSIENVLSKDWSDQLNQELIKLQSILTNSNQLNNLNVKENVLDYLASLLIDNRYSSFVASSCSTILLDLISRLKFTSNSDHIQSLYVLSELICLYPEISEFVYLNYNQNFDPLSLINSNIDPSSDHIQPSIKRIKTDVNDLNDSLITLLHACLNYLYFNSQWFISTWKWSSLFVYLNEKQSNQSNEINYLIYQCLRVIFNLSDSLFYRKLNQQFDDVSLIDLRLKYHDVFKNKQVELPNKINLKSDQVTSLVNQSDDIVSIGRVLLRRKTSKNQQQDDKYVLFNSFRHNLQKLALTVRLDQPALVEGPVGCGKTGLIECLANFVGRHQSPAILKLQMGDQIDRKVLIGSYHCTEIPGRFEWRAGPITRALIDGNWIVLEDIDLAPTELINDIVTILKSKSLDSISGCSFISGKVHSSFRIFFTRRLVEGHSETYRLSDHEVIYKLCERIQFNLPERQELVQIIKTKWPSLDTFADRLIDIYNLVQTSQLVSKSNRKITLRDLIKLCNRISSSFNNRNKEAFTLLLDTCDCFTNYLSGLERKLELAKQIGVLYNFTNEQVSAIYSKRKPVVEVSDSQFKIGRYTLAIRKDSNFKEVRTVYAFNLQSLILLEQVAASITNSESCLLVGETGCGKTSTIQFLASKLKKNLIIINLNQQTDSTDIIGGYKPIAFSFIARKLKKQFEELFNVTFITAENTKFLGNLNNLYEAEDWKKFIQVIDAICTRALSRTNLNPNLLKRWNLFRKKIDNLKNKEFEKFLAFEFIEGNLISAIRDGDWVLLDEINLAEAETLQFLAYILDENNQSFTVLDKNDGSEVRRHADFRLFACMNPSTDVGKKELPIGVRNLFTEIFVEELELSSDLQILTQTYIGNLVNSVQIGKIVQLYLRLKKDSKQSLNGYSSGPYYSLRTFCRALRVSSTNLCKNIKKTLYEAFCLSFLTQLDQNSHEQVEKLIYTYLFGKEKINLSKILTPKPNEDAIELENFIGYWLSRGTKEPTLDTNYILTDSVKRNLFNLIRIISIGRTFPILLQGETSVGKTSMIEWLAQATGNVCYRINNHDHIDLQEYVGNYTVDRFGKLVFKEGLLVEAMRNGYWLILDELNLASTEVLEALNRVLDDNREIFIPEIQATVKAHPKFLLFATQNPPENYGGRKILSRAFRNRFIELQFDEIPGKELEIILSRRCHLPPSYSKKMVDVFRELRNRRRQSGIFAGKSGFVTLRDLFRWGERYKEYSSTIEDCFFDWENYLANEGYMLIGGRVRKNDELNVVKEVLEMKFKTQITEQFLFDNFKELIKLPNLSSKFRHIVWTKNSIRLCCLLFRALKYKEPVLLVGQTGCGKTTFCQLYAHLQQHQLYTVNCHMNTESSDFIGSLRPVRSDHEGKNKLFEWADGPLVNAMNDGSTFLVDEISLADDSVLERLNSLLEPKRTLFLAEKTISEDYLKDHIAGESESIKIVAKDSFRFIGTMNPGGDYAKKELSPALRNRFTEIWCSSEFDEEDIKKIIVHNLIIEKDDFIKQRISDLICEFLNWFKTKTLTTADYSIRDILTIVEFINTTTSPDRDIVLQTHSAVYSSIELLYIDPIGSSAISSYIKSNQLKKEAKEFLEKLVFEKYFANIDASITPQIDTSNYYSINSFCIPYGSNPTNPTRPSSYIMNSVSVNANCSKVLKAMQLSKSILLEGIPGVGKTSLIDALAKAAGYILIRINLSEQTDINDLFGADLPVEGKEAKFEWRDGPLLKALKTENCWILLDELNLASQSVLEGLNACLDHRGEIFVPELNRTFRLNKSETRVFASQNPHLQGGGRKGLPKSFLNRFITIFVDSFSNADMVFILENIFHEIPRDTIQKMVSFNEELINATNLRQKFTSCGQPWEFNLRDLTRWCELVRKEKFKSNDEIVFKPEQFIDLIYIDRFRNAEDRQSAVEIFEKHFQTTYLTQPKGIQLTKNYFQIGDSILRRNSYMPTEFDYQLLPEQTKTLESIMKCCEMGWMSILIGDTNTGKSSLVNLLATLTGDQLKVLSVNSEMDSTELLGGFEQQDCARHYKQLEKEIWSKLNCLFAKCFMGQNLEKFKQILEQWSSKDQLQTDSDDVNIILGKLAVLKNLLNEYLNADRLLNQKCLDLIELINSTKSINGNGTFEWIDSVLIDSIRNGHWLLIDNANLCSASVLDRINSLLEPNGFLIINERGSINDEIPIIRPHPEFRIFLTMNPKQGELSRAMRNRGIEIYLTNHNMLSASTFIIKNFNNDEQCVEKSKLLNSFARSIESQNDLKEKLTSKFFAYYLLYSMNNFLEPTAEDQDGSAEEFGNLKERLFSIRSLMGDAQLFLLDNNLELIKSTQPNSIGRSIALRLIMESTSSDLQRFLLKRESHFRDYFDQNMIKHRLISNQTFLQANHIDTDKIDANELTADLRYSLNLLKKILPDHDICKQISSFTNVWSLSMFFNQIRNHRRSHADSNVVSLFTISNFSSRNQFEKYLPKLFIETITKLYAKLNNLTFDCNSLLSDEQYFELRNCFNWIHYLIDICQTHLASPNDVIIILDKFVTLWIVCFQKNVFEKLELFNLEIKSDLSDISESLNINFFANNKNYDSLIKKFTYEIVPKNANTSTFFSLVWQCMNELFSKDYWFLLKNKQIIKQFINMYKNSIDDKELEQMHTDLKFISTKIKRPHAFELKIDDEERSGDIELKQKFDNSQLTFEANLHSIHQMMFFVMEIQAIDHQSNEDSSILNNLKSFLLSNNIIINPFHQYLFQKSENSNKFELILHHYLDCFKLFRNDTTFKLVNFHDTFNLDLSKDNLTQYEFKLKSFLSDNYWLKEEFIAGTSPVFTLILTKNLLQDNLRLGYLNYQQKQIEEIMKLIPANYLKFYGTFLNSKIYYENLFESWVDLLFDRTSDLVNYQILRSTLAEIIKQLKSGNSKTGQSNFLMCSIGIYTCKLFQPVNALDPIQRATCRLANYELEFNMVRTEIELRRKFCKLNYGRGFNSNEDHPHVEQLLKRKEDLSRKIEKLDMTQHFRPVPSLYFKLKSEIAHFMDNVIHHPNFESSLNCLKEYIDSSTTDQVSDRIQLMVNFKKQINYFLTDLLSKYSQYYDLTCNFLIGICFVYQSVSWILSNANKKLALKRLDINKKLLEKINHLFCYSNNEPNLTTDHLLSLLNSNKLTEMLSRTRSGLQHCHTMLYKATLMEILNAFAFQTDHHKTVRLMDKLIHKFLDTWLEQEELKRQKQEEEDALYHYRVRNADEIVNDEEQLNHDVNLNFPTYEDLYSDLMDSEENREFQLNKLDQQQMTDDVLLKPEIILEIIDLHRSITESVCKETKLEFNFKSSYKLRYSILSELIESYGPVFDQTLDEMVLDGHLIIYDTLNQGVFNQQIENFNIYTDYNVDEIRKCFVVLEKLRDKIFKNLEDQMFHGHVTLRRLLKFILRIHSIQVTQPLIKFLTGLEIILQIAQDWEQIAPRDFKLIYELEDVKALIISWRQIELKNYQNCLDNVFKRIRNQDFLKWWFHFYSMLTELLSSNSEQTDHQLTNFYTNLKNFIDGSTLGEFSNRLILIENFILHGICVNAKHEVIVLMKNLLNYYREIEPKILDHIKTMRKEFDDEIKDKVKIIRWKKVNYFGLKNLITKSHRTVMKNMNKFSRSLNEKVNPHFYNFNSMIDRPNAKWSLIVPDLTVRLVSKISQELINNEFALNLQCLTNLVRFNEKCCKLIVKCISKSVVYESRIIELNDLSNDIVSIVKDLQSLSVDPKITDKEQRKKQIKAITNKKDYQLSELIKIFKLVGLSYQKGLNHSEQLNSSLLQTIRLIEQSIYLDEQSNLNIHSTECHFYKLFNKFVYFLDISQLPNKDVNQQKIDRFKGSILHLIMKIVKTRANLSDQLNSFNEINQTVESLGRLNIDTILSRKLSNTLHLLRDSSIQLKILLIQCKDVLDVLVKSNEFNTQMNVLYGAIPELIKDLDQISIPKTLPVFCYTKDEMLFKLGKINHVVNKTIGYLTQLVDTSNRSKNGVLMNTLQFTLDLKHRLEICCELNEIDDRTSHNEKLNQLVEQTELFTKKVLFRIQETFKYLSSDEFSQMSADEENLLVDLEKIECLTKVLDLKSIKQTLNVYLEQTQVAGQDIDSSQCESIKKLLSNLVTVLNNYLVCAQHYIGLHITKSRCINKLTHVLLGVFNELSKNGFCIPPDLQETDQPNQQDGKFKEVDDAGFGEGEGAQDVSDQIKNLNQIEGLQSDEHKNDEQQEEQKDDMKEEEQGVQMDDDFKGETYDKKEESDEDERDESEEENEMGEVENDDNLLDENVWGKSDDEDESDEKDQNDKGTDNKKGDQEQDDQMVANEDTESLEKTKQDKHKEFENKLIEESEQQEQDETEESDQFKDADKNLEKEESELPENLELYDNESEIEDECKSETDMEDTKLSDNEQNEEEFDEEKSGDLPDNEKEEQIEPDDNNKSSENEKLDNEIKLEEDENAEDKMDVDDNTLDSRKNQNYDENIQFNEDIKNKNEAMNHERPCEKQQENETGADGDQKAYAFENKSNLITDQNMDEMESNDLNLTDGKDDTDCRKLSESTKNLKKKQIMKNERDKKFREQRDKKPNDSDLYRHIDDNMSGDEDVMDKADESHRNNIEMDLDEPLEEEKSRQSEKLDDIEMLDEEVSEQRRMKRNEPKEVTMTNERKDENLSKDNNPNELDERSIVATTSIQRPAETVYHTDLDKLKSSKNAYLSNDNLERIDNLLQKLSSEVKMNDEEVDKESSLAWRECEQVVSPLINELTAQLQLILEPTKTTKFKGDYKSGKRLNMRKIIPYIASQYRKDKIWLRRTKPSKREYQIMLALDDSGSMADNHSKKLAFESLILLGKSLNLLEVGQIGVMSFGEETRVVNSFDEPFNDTMGGKLFSQFTFKQKKTRINDLLSQVKLTMEQCRFGKKARELSQLLMIISDGRGLFSEGEMQLKSKIKKIYESGIFIVFLILDNPEHKDSICDIVVPKFESTGEVTLKNYMEEFPFPFYLIVRNIEQLPNVLGQALRQWFELVTINDN